MRLRPDQARQLADELNAVLDRWMTEYPSDQPDRGHRARLRPAPTSCPLKEWPLVSAPHDRPFGHPPTGRAHRPALAAGRPRPRRSPCCSPRRAGSPSAEIGLLFTVHGVVVTVLELPTGGLADVLGRRPVVVAGAVLHLVSCVVVRDRDRASPASWPAILVLGRRPGAGLRARSRPGTSTPCTGSTRRPTSRPGLSQHSARPTAAASPLGAVVGGFLPALLGGAGAAGARPARTSAPRPSTSSSSSPSSGC